MSDASEFQELATMTVAQMQQVDGVVDKFLSVGFEERGEIAIKYMQIAVAKHEKMSRILLDDPAKMLEFAKLIRNM